VGLVKVERCASHSGDFSTRCDPLPIVPYIVYLFLGRLAIGLLGMQNDRCVVNKVMI